MKHGLLVLGGFVLGTLGMKLAKSRMVHNACVRLTACGLECKDYAEYLVDETKAQCDDIMAEAKALKAEEEASCDAEKPIIEDASNANEE